MMRINQDWKINSIEYDCELLQKAIENVLFLSKLDDKIDLKLRAEAYRAKLMIINYKHDDRSFPEFISFYFNKQNDYSGFILSGVSHNKYQYIEGVEMNSKSIINAIERLIL